MPLIPSELLFRGGNVPKFRKFFIPIGIFIIALATASAFYFFSKNAGNADNQTANSTGPRTLPKTWLVKYFLTEDENAPHVAGPDGDPDDDVLTNLQEFYFGTDPTNPDSDGDGQMDGAEVALNSHPLGEGELYSTDYARKIADQYLEANDLPEFKRENIEKQLNELLTPPKPEDIQLQLDDEKILKVVRSSSPEDADKYLSLLDEKSRDLAISPELIAQSLDAPNNPANPISPEGIYQAINELRKIEVPEDFLLLHQLHIAGLFSMAKIFQIGQIIDPAVDLTEQADKIRAQYYQVATIEKIDLMLKDEVVNLKNKHKTVIEIHERISGI